MSVKFVIRTITRSGGGLLAEALSSAKDVCAAHGYVFDGTTEQTVADMKAAAGWKKLFDRYTVSTIDSVLATGFIAAGYAAKHQAGRGVNWAWTNTLWQYLGDRGRGDVKVINVTREDPVARAISAFFTLKTGVSRIGKLTTAARLYTAKKPTAHMPPWLFIRYLDEWVDANTAAEIAACRNALNVTYENMCMDWQGQMLRVQQYLGLPEMPLTVTSDKMGMMPPHAALSNWDMLQEACRGTPYELYIDRYNSHFLPMYDDAAG